MSKTKLSFPNKITTQPFSHFFSSLHFLFLVLRHTAKSQATENLNFTRAVKWTDNKNLFLKAREREKTSSLTR